MPKSGHLHFNCFNCGASEPFGKFIKIADPLLYNDYIAEKYLKNVKGEDDTAKVDERAKTKRPAFKKNPLSEIKKISQLKHDHPVKKYIEKRQIPSDQHYRLYYAPKFMTWINSLIPDKFQNVVRDEPRLVIPLFDKKMRVFGVSARGFTPKGLRYITIMFDDEPKVFGLEKVDFTKPYSVTEGALDAMFLSNSLAMVGGDANMTVLENIENATFVHDSEPRNLQICNRMDKLLQAGHRVCIWPTNVPAKDINDMHLHGMKDIEQIIKQNSFKGLEGQLRLREWKKCG
jgi:hypothetical protein